MAVYKKGDIIAIKKLNRDVMLTENMHIIRHGILNDKHLYFSATGVYVDGRKKHRIKLLWKFCASFEFTLLNIVNGHVYYDEIVNSILSDEDGYTNWENPEIIFSSN